MSVSQRMADLAADCLATWFGSGLAPRAPGTFGTLAALPLAWWIWHRPAVEQGLWLTALTTLGVWASHRRGRRLGTADHQTIVIDEVAGLVLTGLAVDPTVGTAAGAVVLFRLFDITKPWPVRWIDRRMKNGLGVMLDDLAAGLLARVALGLATSLVGP